MIEWPKKKENITGNGLTKEQVGWNACCDAHQKVIEFLPKEGLVPLDEKEIREFLCEKFGKGVNLKFYSWDLIKEYSHAIYARFGTRPVPNLNEIEAVIRSTPRSIELTGKYSLALATAIRALLLKEGK